MDTVESQSHAEARDRGVVCTKKDVSRILTSPKTKGTKRTHYTRRVHQAKESPTARMHDAAARCDERPSKRTHVLARRLSLHFDVEG